MKNENGITIITLVVTIVIMLILTGIVTNSGMKSIETAKKTAFISEMEMIQAKVNTIYEERKQNSENIEYYNNIGRDISTVDNDKVTIALGDIDKTGFRYFGKSDLKQISLDNISQEVLINYDTREVVSLNGIEIDGVTYYKLKDIPNYVGYNVDYTNKNTEAPTFTVEQTKLEDNSYKFTVKDIEYSGNVQGGTVSYKLHSDTNWILNGDNLSFIVNQKGLYNVRFTDKAGNSAVQDIYIEDELYREDFDSFGYNVFGTQVNSCNDSILNVTSTNTEPKIFMNNVTNFNPLEYRYLEIKYKTTDNHKLELFMIEEPTDQTYAIKATLQTNGEWNTVVIDLWSNNNVKNRTQITGWRFDWGENTQGISMQIDYIRIY